jgi:hypothetical protein
MKSLRPYRVYITGMMLALSASMLRAEEPLTASPADTRWHYARTTHTATLLGSDHPNTEQLELKKDSVLGATITVQSDANSIQVSSGNSSALVFAVAPQPDGATTVLKLDGGDDPRLTLNGQQSPRWQGTAVAGNTTAMPVIADGFLIAPPIEKTWYWWWDWRWEPGN